MDMKHRVIKNRAGRDLAAALQALRRLDGRVVERCPQPDCAFCSTARRSAA